MYVHLVYELDADGTLPKTGESVGVDMGVTTRFALSNGVNYARCEPEKFPDLQRRIARCVKGSNGQRKLYARLSRVRRKDKMRRRGALHEITTEIVRSYDFIAIEYLKTDSMTRSASGTAEEPGRGVSQKRGLNRSVREQSWSEARRQLEYKSLWAGREIVAVNSAYTSQICSECGAVNAKSRRGKSCGCRGCGMRMDTETNASRVILADGLALKNAGGNSPRGESPERQPA